MSDGGMTESIIEQAALAWLASLGWTVKPGPEIAPGELAAERVDYGQVLLTQRLQDTLCERKCACACGESCASMAIHRISRSRRRRRWWSRPRYYHMYGRRRTTDMSTGAEWPGLPVIDGRAARQRHGMGKRYGDLSVFLGRL